MKIIVDTTNVFSGLILKLDRFEKIVPHNQP